LGDDWKKAGAWTLRHTGQLILVGSPAAIRQRRVGLCPFQRPGEIDWNNSAPSLAENLDLVNNRIRPVHDSFGCVIAVREIVREIVEYSPINPNDLMPGSGPVQLTAFGNPVDGLECVDIPEPDTPGPNQVLIGSIRPRRESSWSSKGSATTRFG
jgi:hypothetical protein